ncbi:endonuclease/exonuclease/phosphatase family protein [Georgenia sp. EYE_87]|uniref:exodeoxyribonuclease III n=1 Tax=Georgenia sp. EYE_87 TaxID=2853448 RepID=UPI002006957F|nr:exodeoxyribonuclease III [Georgenia sp. EYE_87]MCK6209989.1 endonuclease/exonuclease/phosphatase family protein [Georgenia sp. EYE_87]
MKIASVNVNGIRAAYKRGMGRWVEERRPDVMLLQEVRATDDVLEAHLGQEWTTAHHACDVRGRAGVAIASRLPATAVRVGLGNGVPEEPVDTGRWVEMDLDVAGAERPLTVVSVYVHSGTANTPKMEAKYAHLEKVTKRLGELAEEARDGRRDVVVGGDLNIVHREVDIKNWKGNHNKASGVLDEEIAYLDKWFADGWVDVGRKVAGDRPGPYTWWSWRGKAFDNDAGWRIDYQLATPELAERVTDAGVDRAASYDQRFSDHAPVVATYDVQR